MFTKFHTVAEIKSEYRRLAKLHHPDLGGDLEKMKRVNLQYHAALLNVNGQARTDNGRTFTYNYNEQTEQAIMDKVMEILGLGLDNLEVEIIGIWVWVSGSTKDQKDLLNRKGVGLKWHSERLMWYWKPYNGRTRYAVNKSTDDLRAIYGSRQFQGQQDTTLATA